MHQVLANWGPRERRDLDLFEEVILRLMAANVTDTAELARRTRLTARLVATIAAGLRDRNYSRSDGTLTEWGLGKLEASEAPGEMRIVRVFQETRTGAVWPRVALDLPYVPTVWGRTPRVRLGTPGKPDDRDAIVAWEGRDVEMPSAVDVETIRDALIGHRRAQRAAGDDANPLAPGVMTTIHPVAEPPIPIFLATVAYGSGMHSNSGGRWDVADPFGLAASMPFLRREVAVAAERVAGMRDELERLDVVQAPNDFDAQFAREELLEHQLAHIELESPRVFDLLVDMRASIAAAPHVDRSDGARRDAMVATQRAVEAAHVELISRYPAPVALVDLLGHKGADSALITALAERVGFDNVPRRLARTHAGKIQAVSSGGGSLRSLVVYALLQASEELSHPYTSAAQSDPTLLVDLDRLASLRDEAAHGWVQPPSQDVLEEMADVATACVSLLLPPSSVMVN